MITKRTPRSDSQVSKFSSSASNFVRTESEGFVKALERGLLQNTKSRMTADIKESEISPQEHLFFQATNSGSEWHKIGTHS